MCDLICDVIIAVFEDATRVKSMYTIKSWLKARKMRNYGSQKKFLKNIHLKGGLGMELSVC